MTKPSKPRKISDRSKEIDAILLEILESPKTKKEIFEESNLSAQDIKYRLGVLYENNKVRKYPNLIRMLELYYVKV